MEISDHGNPYEFYTCDYGHCLQWCGDNLKSSNKCCKCKKNYFDNEYSVIRWRCILCRYEYCQGCTKILKCKRCPINHEYKISCVKKYCTLVCDICFSKVTNIEKAWMDEICNISFCKDCVGDMEILEENVYTFED